MPDKPAEAMCVDRVGPSWVDPGTSCRQRSSRPGITGQEASVLPRSGDSPLLLYSPGIREVAKVGEDILFSPAPALTWDAFARLIYDEMNKGIQAQANRLLELRNIAPRDAEALVNSRNLLLLRTRKWLSPFGELYSEILKPRSSLKTFEQFLEQKGTIRAVLKSVGSTRVVVDEFAVRCRILGPATIVLEIVMTAVVIREAPEKDRALVTSRQAGGLVGSLSFGLAGMWAGCASAAAIASPSLVVPIAGEVTEGGACLIGGLIGGGLIGFGGRKLGEQAGENVYQLYTEMTEFGWWKPN